MDYSWKMDFSFCIGKTWIYYGTIPMENKSGSQSYVSICIDNKEYEISNICEYINYYGQEENTALFQIQEETSEEYQQIDVNETIKAIHLVQEEQKYFEHNELLYQNTLTRAILIETENKQYCFEKDDVSFSEMIRIYSGKDLLSIFPKRNSWFEDEVFYGMEEVTTSCIQTIQSFKKEELVFRISQKEMEAVIEFKKKHNHCKEEDFLYTFGRQKIRVECICGSCLEIRR